MRMRRDVIVGHPCHRCEHDRGCVHSFFRDQLFVSSPRSLSNHLHHSPSCSYPFLTFSVPVSPILSSALCLACALQAVDLYVLERALESTHTQKGLMDKVMAGYKVSKRAQSTIAKLIDVRMRGRKRVMVG